METTKLVIAVIALSTVIAVAVNFVIEMWKLRREERESRATAEELKPFSLSADDHRRVVNALADELEKLSERHQDPLSKSWIENPLAKSWIEKQIAALSLKARSLGAKTDADYERERLAAEVAKQIKLQQETEEWRKDPPVTRRIITDIRHPEARAYWEKKNPHLRGADWDFCLIDADTYNPVADNSGAHRALVWFAVETPREDRRPVKTFKWELVSGKLFDRDGIQHQTLHAAFKMRDKNGLLELMTSTCTVEALDFPITPEGGNNLLHREV